MSTRSKHLRLVTDYPSTAQDWPKLLEHHEAEQFGGYEVPDPMGISGGEKIAAYQRELAREKAAGYAHAQYWGLFVDGGPVTETTPRKRTRLKMLDGLIVVLGVLLMSGVLVLGIQEVMR